jgi:hypothetical protein
MGQARLCGTRRIPRGARTTGGSTRPGPLMGSSPRSIEGARQRPNIVTAATNIPRFLPRSPATPLGIPLHADVGLMADRGRDLLLGADRRRLKRGSFHWIVDLPAAINRYIAEHNADPKPFIWTKRQGRSSPTRIR